jgi:hypothetical protein
MGIRISESRNGCRNDLLKITTSCAEAAGRGAVRHVQMTVA